MKYQGRHAVTLWDGRVHTEDDAQVPTCRIDALGRKAMTGVDFLLLPKCHACFAGSGFEEPAPRSRGEAVESHEEPESE